MVSKAHQRISPGQAKNHSSSKEGKNCRPEKLLTLRFGLEGAKPLPPEDTGKMLGLTPEEVVAKEAAALMKLRGN